ncbi:MAG: leucine-rich repeat protein [Bacteroidales bacterium]|nr:leucine-rich repeat protein [Bacteroidales bacterium]
MMKRFVILLVAALALPLAAVAQYEAYQNLSAVSPSGHTLYYTIVDGHAEVAPQYWGSGQAHIGYYATSLTGDVVIPSRVTLQGNSYDVTAIGQDAFHYCDAMQSVTMPSSVTKIGISAFVGCTSLTTVNFSENITSMDYAAFNECTGLTTLTLPASLTTIGQGVFHSCSGLTSLVIPSSVTSIGRNAFYGCSGLTSITVENGNTEYDSRGGCNAIIETRTNTLVVGCKNTVIPNTVTSIGDNAYAKCSGLTSLNIPSSVTSIGEFAFAYCNGLTSLYIPNTLTTIGEEAFFYCEGLNSVFIGTAVTSIGEKAFFYCSGLNMLTIGNSVTRIENQAFDYCSNLMSITCRATVPPAAGTNAFRGVPTNATVFVPCASLGAYQSANGWREFTDMQGMPELEFDAAVTSGQVLHFTVNLDGTTVTVSGHVDDISGDLIIPSTISYCGNNYDVTAIGQDAFQNCDEMVSITMPNSVTTIGSSAFVYCQSLTTVNLSENVTAIGSYAFAYCQSLTTVNFSENVTTIGSYAFAGCQSLATFNFSENLTSIDDNAFNYCTSLTAPTFPASLTSIGSGAFAYCYSLSPIICQATVPPTAGVEAFLEVPTYATIIVPCASRGAYQLANEWSNFTGIIGGDRYTESTSTDQTLVYILDCANGTATVMGYEGECSGTLNIPSSITVNEVSYSVTRIADNAFQYNTGITSLTIPSGLTYIGDSAFIECTSLNSVNVNLFGNYLDTIGKMAFWRCYNLSTFNFYPCYNLKYIGDAAFGYCNLTSLRFRESVRNFGEDGVNLINPFRFCPIDYIDGNQNEYYRYENNTIINNALNEVVTAATTAGVPASVTSIRTAAYASTALRKIVVPEGVTKIGLSFIYDGSVDSLLLPSTLTDLHYYALDGCATLKYIEFAEGIQNVPGFGVGMYSSESTPEEIVLPSTTTNIGHISIYNGLQRVVCKALVPPTFAYSTYDFNSQNADDLLTIIVPCESVDAYRNADVWSRYNIQGVDCTPIPEGPTNISVNVDGNAVVVAGATGNTVTLYNADGDVVASRTAPAGEPLRFESLTTGTYYVKIGILPARMKVEVR